MRFRSTAASLILAALAVPVMGACSSPSETTEPVGVGGTTGTTGGTAGTGGSAAGTGGTAGTGTGGTTGGAGGTTGGSAGTGGAGGSAGAATGGGAGMGGSAGGTAGSGTSGAGGTGTAGSFPGGGTGGMSEVPPLDCGGKGTVVENAGPPGNRVNYVIAGDGYAESEFADMDEHIAVAMEKRFSDPIGQVYLRYRKFVNICALKIPSTPICGSSTFDCCGNDQSRLANCDTGAVNDAIGEYLPESFEVDWRAVMLNGDSWWNTGAQVMLWSGAHPDSAGAALHEGGHGFHQLADEYANCGSQWVNNSGDDETSGGKWNAWIDYDQQPGTGMQGFFACEGNSAFRPSDNSMMNMLFGDDPDTSFNPVSREKMIMDIWRIIENPWDAVNPPAGAVMNPATLALTLIDPAVINVEWSVDGTVVNMNGGPVYNVGAAGLAPGSHMITARAYDNAGMDLVRQTTGTQYNRQYWGTNASKTVTWTVTIP